jgi:hypothetical protein
MGLKAFRRIYASNAEDTHGTAEAAVEVLRGVLAFEDENELHRPEYDRNSLALYHEDDEFVSKRVSLAWTFDLNFRHILWPLLMGVRGNVTPTQPDSTNEPNAYLWTFAPSLTGANTPDQANGIETFTFEFGDDDQAFEAGFCFATEIEISGEADGVVEATVSIVGDEKSETSFTGGLSEQSVQLAPFNLAKIYIDDDGGTMGSTQKTGLLRAFTWTLETGLFAFPTADGSLTFGAVSEGRKAPELELVYKAGSDAETERGHYRSRNTRLVRIELNGQTELDSGQDNPPYLQLDQAIRYEHWPMIDDDDGQSIISVPAYGVYNSGYGKVFECAVLNDVSALPT